MKVADLINKTLTFKIQPNWVISLYALNQRDGVFSAKRNQSWCDTGAMIAKMTEHHSRIITRPISHHVRRKEKLAEREGFEPPIPLRVFRISSAARSTTLPPLRPYRFGNRTSGGGVIQKCRGSRKRVSRASEGHFQSRAIGPRPTDRDKPSRVWPLPSPALISRPDRRAPRSRGPARLSR